MNIEFKFTIEQEDIPVRGNAIASGDDVFDRRVEDEIITRLTRGDICAWCSVRVDAMIRVEGQLFVGTAGLSACSANSDAEVLMQARQAGTEDEARSTLVEVLREAVRRGLAAQGALREIA